ncbi:MAG: S1C family serine protease, partial [Puniceicoccales bacterium]|nr:S1C family serine protease [Puniceicoccales bacterium]
MRCVFYAVALTTIGLLYCNGDTSDGCVCKNCGTAIEFSAISPFSFVSDIFSKRKNSVVRIIGIRIDGNDSSNTKPDAKTETKSDASNREKSAEHNGKILFGSGFFIDDLARTVTSATIVDAATNIWVEYNGLSYAAELVGLDRVTNIAIVRLLKKPDNFDFIDIMIGKPRDSVQCGEFLVSVECKLGLDPAPNFGIVVGENSSYENSSFPVKLTRT